MPPIQVFLYAIVLAAFVWQVWAMLITGRLSVGKPEDESDERWTRAFLGSLVIALGGVSFLVSEPLIRMLALALFIGGVVLVLSAFFPGLRRR